MHDLNLISKNQALTIIKMVVLICFRTLHSMVLVLLTPQKFEPLLYEGVAFEYSLLSLTLILRPVKTDQTFEMY